MNDSTGGASVLLAAIDILSAYGWTQGVTYNGETGQMDILGALARAAGCKLKDLNGNADDLLYGIPEANVGKFLAAWRALEMVLPDVDPVEWNDEADRTFEEVERYLLRASDRLRIMPS